MLDLQPECNIRSRFEDENEAAGSDGQGEKEEVQCEVVHRQEESRVSEELHEDLCGEANEDGLGSHDDEEEERAT